MTVRNGLSGLIGLPGMFGMLGNGEMIGMDGRNDWALGRDWDGGSD